MEDYEYATEAEAVAKLTAKPELINPLIEGDQNRRVPAILRPDGEVEYLTRLLANPIRPQGYVEICDIDDFISFVNSHKLSDSDLRIHNKSLDVRFDQNAGGFRDAGAIYTPNYTVPYKSWVGHSGKRFNQDDFVVFLEDHLGDIHNAEGMPSAGQILEFCSCIEGMKKTQFKRKTNPQTGAVTIIYTETGDAGKEQELKLFKEFTVALKPLMDLDVAYSVKVKLRFEIKDNTEIYFTFNLQDLDQVEASLKKAMKDHLAKTDLPIYLASFETPDADL